MISDALKIAGICLILLGGLLGLLSFFTVAPDLNILVREVPASVGAAEMRGEATLEGKRLLLAIFGAASFTSGVSMLLTGIILTALRSGR
ncbi:MAG TPA: hypothetical protein VGD10_01165 [Allosphingosinicella sp.]|uniref:hypothetical protein n=1 Tax=Allosphingosinicella sp. TaxID=2823234 RepID=UPI002ED7A212